ncbi:MAG: hypothetical protein F9K32_12110 [Desulfobulbaceae bacterium]|nr:MAG: hypothetical protein F9K32_12110 [Desulfobulbaceae bacterium]
MALHHRLRCCSEFAPAEATREDRMDIPARKGYICSAPGQSLGDVAGGASMHPARSRSRHGIAAPGVWS